MTDLWEVTHIFDSLMCRLVRQLFRSAKFGGKAHYGDTRSQKVNKCVSDGRDEVHTLFTMFDPSWTWLKE